MSSVASEIATIVHCIERARAEHAQAGDSFGSNFTHQDAAILNILRACVPACLRACESAVDLANMLARTRRLGLPSEMRESFALLERGGFIPVDLSQRVQNLVGFRNIAAHQYKKFDLAIVESVIHKGRRFTGLRGNCAAPPGYRSLRRIRNPARHEDPAWHRTRH